MGKNRKHEKANGAELHQCPAGRSGHAWIQRNYGRGGVEFAYVSRAAKRMRRKRAETALKYLRIDVSGKLASKGVELSYVISSSSAAFRYWIILEQQKILNDLRANKTIEEVTADG